MAVRDSSEVIICNHPAMRMERPAIPKHDTCHENPSILRIMRQYTGALPSGQNKEAEPAKGISFGSSAIFSKDPPLSYSSREGIGFVGK
jgi:hypothetical protein